MDTTGPRSLTSRTTLRRLAIYGIAAAAVLLVAVPTQMVEPWRWLAPHWMYRATIALANTAALGASLLAVVLMIRVPRDDAAFSLAMVVSASAASFGLWSSAFQIHALNAEWVVRAASAAQYALAVVAAAAYLRFGATFPRRVTADDLKAALALQPRVIAIHRWLLRPENPWRAATSLSILIIGLSMAGASEAAAVLTGSAAFMAWVIAHIQMRTGYASCTEVEQRRALWVVEGFLLILVPAVVVETVLMPLVLMNVPVTELFAGSFFMALAAGAVGLVTCLGIATFYSGSFDSALVIRRTTLYSGIVVILTGIFAVVENIVTNAIAAYIPLPSNVGVMVGAVTIALAFAPLRAKLKAFVERNVPASAHSDTRMPVQPASLEDPT